jgi:glycosyltransferase A (GT-A) superfamily protein (DUF2064 family)
MIGSDQQHGADFGEKLANAFDNVFAKGYEKVIALGNDCLELSVALLKRATEQLKKNDCVYGQAADGGCYLIGETESAFDKGAFTALPWKTSCLYEALVLHSKPWVKVSQMLPVLHDLDTETDAYQNRSSVSLAAVVLNLINSSAKQLIGRFDAYHLGYFITLFQLRAPPVL